MESDPRNRVPPGAGASAASRPPSMADAVHAHKAKTVSAADYGARPAGADTGPTYTPGTDEPTPADAFKAAAAQFGEIKEYASYYVGAKLDSMKGSVRNLVLYAALGVMGLIVGGGLLITAAVLLLTGLAGAIGAIFEKDRPWFGAIVVGLLVLGGAAAGVVIGLKKVTGASRKRTVQKYETRQRIQREQFGHDVHDLAAERQARRAEERPVRGNGRSA